MSKIRVQNIGLFLLGLIILIMIAPLGIMCCEHYGKGDFSYFKCVMYVFGVILFILSLVSGCFLSVMSFIAFRQDEKITKI